jgi:hypothetical protein
MKLVSIAVALFFGMHCAHAAIIDQIDDLNIRKIEAEDGVKTIKAHFLPTKQQYKIGKEKYEAAQKAFNIYTMAVLNNYKLNAEIKLDKTAELASSRAQEFHKYVSSLGLQKSPAIIITTGLLVELAHKLYTYIVTEKQKERETFTETVAPQITWADWDKI